MERGKQTTSPGMTPRVPQRRRRRGGREEEGGTHRRKASVGIKAGSARHRDELSKSGG